MSTFDELLDTGPALRAAKKFYKKPTDIQREVMPVIATGSDIVAMSKTGSGKTAAFLLPMIQKLKEHSKITGARCIVVSPSRELSNQSLKFFGQYTEFTNLKACSLIGGEPLPPQFDALTMNPDVIFCTPGRLLQIVGETQYSLERIQMLIIDEADVLFEQNLSEQMTGIIQLIPPNAQKLLFSATIPSVLAEFTKLNLKNAIVVKVDISKVSDTLTLEFKYINSKLKPALLLNTINKCKNCMVFVSTKYHAEYLSQLCIDNCIKALPIFGGMDQDARSHNLASFKRGSTKVLLVTDVAARGIDVEELDMVVNYDFPDRPKIFIHRSGRAGRAGKLGKVVTFVSEEDMVYYAGTADSLQDEDNPWKLIKVYQKEIEDEISVVDDAQKKNIELVKMQSSMYNAEKKYLDSRKKPMKHWKALAREIEPITTNTIEERVSNYRPKLNIFEQNKQNQKQVEMMKSLRAQNQSKVRNTTPIVSSSIHIEESESDGSREEIQLDDEVDEHKPSLKKEKVNSSRKVGEKTKSKYFIDYLPKGDDVSSIRDGSHQSLLDSVLDITPDDQTMIKKNFNKNIQNRQMKAFESKSTLFIQTAISNMTKTNVKGNKYKEWLSTSKRAIQKPGEEEKIIKGKSLTRKQAKKIKSEIRTPREIEIERLKKQKNKLHNAKKHKEAAALNKRIYGRE